MLDGIVINIANFINGNSGNPKLFDSWAQFVQLLKDKNKSQYEEVEKHIPEEYKGNIAEYLHSHYSILIANYENSI